MSFFGKVFSEINRGIERFKDDPTGGLTSLNKSIGLKGLTGQRAIEDAMKQQKADAEAERLAAAEELKQQRIADAQAQTGKAKILLGTKSNNNKAVGVSSSLGLSKGDTGVQI